MPREGDIAFCSNRELGLIQRVKGSPISGVMYYGIHLSQDKYGHPWQSKHPQVVGNIHDILTSKNITKEETPDSN